MKVYSLLPEGNVTIGDLSRYQYTKHDLLNYILYHALTKMLISFKKLSNKQLFENQKNYLTMVSTPLSISQTVSQRISISSAECEAIKMVFP